MRNEMTGQNELKWHKGKWPAHGWLGLGLVALFWILNWSLPGVRTHWIFFPLWLGYCLTVDACVYFRKGESLLTRNPWAYATLFLISIPVWWLFELLNVRTQNWFYEGRHLFTEVQYAVLASLSFSTVIPAVFGAAELASTFKWLGELRSGPRIAPTRRNQVGFFLAGWLMLLALLIWPRYCFPFLWLSVYFILEPINAWLGNRSLLHDVAKGDWRPVLALWTGCIICSFFWEMWNFYSYPKWVYQVPFVDFLHVFEMPLLGYLGYLPFSLELYAVYNLVTGVFGGKETREFVRIYPVQKGASA